ncbi:MAG TPA: hypothetical protein VM537_34695 [Anaerolineae bacterium]|nr:hypothetical protein [Anaerolineae bacterium]
MRCPRCGMELVRGEPKEYETLSEHVSNPNQEEYPLRATYACPAGCGNNTFWDPDGAEYGRNFPGLGSARDSFAEASDARVAAEMAK